jgi:ribosome-binding factor A
MPENRAHKHHLERRGEALREEISTIVEGELTDPRIGLVSVTEVQLSDDGKSAHVFVAVEGEERDEGKAMEGLSAAKGFIKHQLIARLGLRHSPELYFHLDKSEKYGARIDELLERIKRRKR